MFEVDHILDKCYPFRIVFQSKSVKLDVLDLQESDH